jgi:hypothetical protein
MNYYLKIIIIVTVTAFALFQSATSNAQETDSLLKGKWIGNGSLNASTNGFSPSTDIIKMDIYQQEDSKFKGRLERIYRGNIVRQDIQGYLDHNRHNLCFIDQKNKNMTIGYVASKTIMKLYCWENSENSEITVYILRKTKSVTN